MELSPHITYINVFFDSSWSDAFGNDNNLLLSQKAKKNLSCRLTMLHCNLIDRWVLEKLRNLDLPVISISQKEFQSNINWVHLTKGST